MPKSPTPEPLSPRAPSPPSPRVLLAYRLLKLAGLVLGLPASMLCLMALIGAFTDNGYARVAGALIVAFGLPLILADRLLPAHDPTRARGLVTDVFAVTWMMITCGVAALAGGATRPLLAKEGDRLVSAGQESVARGAYLLAGVNAAIPGAAVAVPATSSSAVAMDGGAAPDASAAAVTAPTVSAPAPPSSAKPKGEKTPAEIFKDLSPSVVTVFIRQKLGEGGGTGFVVDNDGTLATNHHVIDGAQQVRVKFQNGAVFDDVELLADESTADLALLHINLSAPVDGGPHVDAVPLTLGDSEGIVVGERAVSIGNPLGLESTLTDGLVSSRRLYEGRAWIQFSAPISPGNSGGPLFNMRGEVIGITTATLSGIGHGMAIPQNINLAVPVNELKKLFRPSYPGRHKFGDGSAPSHW